MSNDNSSDESTEKEAWGYSRIRSQMWRKILSRKNFFKDPMFFLRNFRNWMIYLLFLKKREQPMEILIHPDPRLKVVCEPIDFEKMSLKERTALSTTLAATLLEQMKGDRLGIAAPQVGIQLRAFIYKGTVAFNPSFKPAKSIEYMQEACYSVPGKVYLVERAKYGWATYKDQYGEGHEVKLNDIDAIVFQHELDHLDGKCLPDYGKEL